MSQRWLFLPNSVLKDLEILARLNQAQVETLDRILSSDTGKQKFSLFLNISESLGISDQDAANLYSFWSYVQEERTEYRKSGEDVIAEFMAFLKARFSGQATSEAMEHVIEIASLIFDKRPLLAQLFGEHPSRDLALKTLDLESGTIPHLDAFKTYCDLRPVYNKDASEIERYVAVITLRVATHGHYEEAKELSVSLSEPDIDKIEAEISRLRKKMEILKHQHPGITTARQKTRRRRK